MARHTMIRHSTTDVFSKVMKRITSLLHVLSSCEGHIKSTGVVEEANPLMFVRPNTGKYDEIFLSSLKCINAGNLDFLFANKIN